jgi:ATP-binding cassette subfamily C protein
LTISTKRPVHALIAELWRFDRQSTTGLVVLNLAGALLEGMGLMLLVPVLHVAGVFGGTISPFPMPLPSGLANWLADFAQAHRLILLLFVFVGLIILQSAINMKREVLSVHLRLSFADHLRNRLFRGMARSRWSFLSRHHSSEFLNVLSSDVPRVGVVTMGLFRLLTQCVILPAYLAVALHLSPAVTLLALCTSGLLWWALRKSRNASHAHGKSLGEAYQAFFRQIQEFVGALKLIKIHGEENAYERQFDRIVIHLTAQERQFQALIQRSQLVFRIGSAIALAAMTYVSLAWIQVPGADLLVLIAIFARMLPQMSQIHMNVQQIAQSAPAFESWQRWVADCDAHAEKVPDSPTQINLTRGIVLRDVSYQHPKGNRRFDIPSLMIPAHRTTAIVGPTGSGKTTLLDLISGLSAPDSGTIEADGMPIGAHPAWRRQIAYIPQDTVILDGTIRENLTWGASDLDDDRIMTALSQAAAVGFVRGLPEGLATWVGERGVRLSGGEKQRLALARALLRNPQVLILDEATSALDRDHQQVILEALKRLHGRMTVLFVTHRLAEIRELIDGIVTVERGHIGPWIPSTPP